MGIGLSKMHITFGRPRCFRVCHDLLGGRRRTVHASAMDTTTAVEITTQSIHDLTVAIERIADARTEPDRKSVLEAAKRIRQRRSSITAILDAGKCAQD